VEESEGETDMEGRDRLQSGRRETGRTKAHAARTHLDSSLDYTLAHECIGVVRASSSERRLCDGQLARTEGQQHTDTQPCHAVAPQAQTNTKGHHHGHDHDHDHPSTTYIARGRRERNTEGNSVW
jgi:hypothetical protein